MELPVLGGLCNSVVNLYSDPKLYQVPELFYLFRIQIQAKMKTEKKIKHFSQKYMGMVFKKGSCCWIFFLILIIIYKAFSLIKNLRV